MALSDGWSWEDVEGLDPEVRALASRHRLTIRTASRSPAVTCAADWVRSGERDNVILALLASGLDHRAIARRMGCGIDPLRRRLTAIASLALA